MSITLTAAAVVVLAVNQALWFNADIGLTLATVLAVVAGALVIADHLRRP